MEDWQINYIRRNLPTLITQTKCSGRLIATLVSKSILGAEDVEILETQIPTKAAFDLYDILFGRRNAYAALLNALHDDKQTGALETLYQGLIIHHLVRFQRTDICQICLNSFHPSFSPNWVSTDAEFMRHWITNIEKSPIMVKNSVPATPQYYVQRHISSIPYISPEVFLGPVNDIFLVKGIEQYQLTNLVGRKAIKLSSSQTKEISGQFIILEYDRDYDEICKLAEYPVHWLSYHEAKLKWVKSQGSILNIQRYILHQQQQCMDELKFMKECLASRNHICITDTPGMGKSILLARIGEQIMKADPLAVVRFIVLPEFIRPMSRQQFSLDEVCNMIADMSSDFQVGRELVLQSLRSDEVKCYLLLDGYDEILHHQVKTANAIFECLKQLKNTQLYVTTRPHKKRELEQVLGTLGFNMNPFILEDQIKFLTGFWTSDGAKNNEVLDQFAKACLENLKRGMDENERDIAGIPLQCFLLAKVHHDHAVRVSSRLTKATTVPETVSSVFEMYQTMMAISFAKLDNKELRLNLLERIAHFILRTSPKQTVFHTHFYYAIELLFPEYCHNIRNLLLHTGIKTYQYLIYNPGVLEAGLDIEYPRFVHWTFAEYLLASFVVEFYHTKYSHLQELLFELVLANSQRSESVWKEDWITLRGSHVDSVKSYTFNYPIVCYFLNSFLKTSQIQICHDKLEQRHSESFLSIFIAAIVHDFYPIAKILSRVVALHTSLEEIPWPTLFLLGAKHARADTFKLLTKFFKKCVDVQHISLEYPLREISFCNGKYVVTPLHVAIQRGEYALTVSLLDQNIERIQMNPSDPASQNLLHVCVYGSSQQSTAVVSAKIQIIQLLADQLKHLWHRLIEETISGGITPLLQTSVHFELIKCLIDVGADVNACTQLGDTLLHTVLNDNGVEPTITEAQYENLVTTLSKIIIFRHFCTANNKGRSPLHDALQHFNLSVATLTTFSKNKVDMNATDRTGNPIPFSGISGGRSQGLLHELVDLGARISHVNHFGETALHIACKSGNEGAVDYLLLNVPSILNQKDKEGNNALHVAVSYFTPEHERIQLQLIGGGIELNSANSKGCSPFLHGMKHGKGIPLRTITALEMHGYLFRLKEVTEGLHHLLKNLMVWQWNHKIIAAAEHLMGKSYHVISRKDENPWTRLALNFEKLAEVTVWNGPLIKSLQRMRIVDENLVVVNETAISKSKSIYNIIKSIPGSYERMMISLISSQQTQPFIILKQGMQKSTKEFIRFLTPPPGLIESIGNVETKILVICSDDPDTTLIRIRNTIDPENTPEVLTHSWKPSQEEAADVQFVVCTSADSLEEHFRRLVVAVKKIVCIVSGKESNHVINNLALNENPPQIITDVIQLQDLSARFRTVARLISMKFLNESSIFQKLMKLSDLELLALIDLIESCVVQEKGFAKANLIPMQLANSMLRFAPRMIVSRTVFDFVLGDVLGFTGISEDELKSLAKWGQLVSKSSERLLTEYILLENDHDFKWISKHPDVQNAHLLHHHAGLFKLVASHGSRYNICSHLNAYENQSLPLHQLFFHSPDEVVKIIFVPDSFHMFQLTEVLRDSNLVISIELDKAKLDRIREGVAAGAEHKLFRIFVDLLCNEEVDSSVEENVHAGRQLDLVMHPKSICDKDISILRALVDFVRKECRNVNLWFLTTRQDILQTVERELEVSAYDMCKISQVGKAQHVAAMWKSPPGERNILEEFAWNCLADYEIHENTMPVFCDGIKTQFSQLLFKPSDKVEFYTFLIGKCFESDAKQIQRSSPILSVTHLCNMFVEEMIRAGFSRKLKAAHFSQIVINLKFPDWKDIFCQEEDESAFEILVSSGVLRKYDEEGCTFAFDEFVWYFIALLFVEAIPSENCNMERLVEFFKFVLPSQLCWGNLTECSLNKLWYFVNFLLEIKSPDYFLPLFAAVHVSEIDYVTLTTELVKSSYLNILKLVEMSIPATTIIDDELVGNAITFGDLSTLTHMCEKFTSFNFSLRNVKINFNNQSWSPLQMAAYRGDFANFEYLIDIEIRRNSLLLLLKERLLFACVKDSHRDEHKVIKQKAKIIRFLLGGQLGQVNETDSDLNTPLLLPQVHVHLLRVLISLGAYINAATTMQASTVFHLVASYANPVQFHQLLSHSLRYSKYRPDLSMKDSKGYTMLHKAILNNMEVSDDSLEVLKSRGVDFNPNERWHESLLYYAIRCNGSARFIDKLIECGAHWTEELANVNFLHEAAGLGNLSAIRVLISRGAEVNSRGWANRTPLHYALFGDAKNNLLETVRLLVGCNADVNASDGAGLTPLDYSVAQNKSPNIVRTVAHLLSRSDTYHLKISPESVNKNYVSYGVPGNVSPEEFLVLLQLIADNEFLHNVLRKRSRLAEETLFFYVARKLDMKEDTLKIFLRYIDVNASDGDGNTILLAAIEGMRSAEFIQMLIRNGADPSIRNKSKQNVFHKAATSGNESVLKHFLSLPSSDGSSTSGSTLMNFDPKYVAEQDADGNTPLHLVFGFTCFNIHDVASILTNSGAEVNIKNNAGDTPLDIAIHKEKFAGLSSETVELLRRSNNK